MAAGVTAPSAEEIFAAATRAAKTTPSGAAWTRLGKLYAKGSGVRRSYRDAAMCYRRAERAGDKTGAGLLAMCLITGTGVEREKEKGVRMLKDSAEGGDVTSMRNCVWLFGKGGGKFGVNPDSVEVGKWEKEIEKVRGGRGRSGREGRRDGAGGGRESGREERVSARDGGEKGSRTLEEGTLGERSGESKKKIEGGGKEREGERGGRGDTAGVQRDKGGDERENVITGDEGRGARDFPLGARDANAMGREKERGRRERGERGEIGERGERERSDVTGGRREMEREERGTASSSGRESGARALAVGGRDVGVWGKTSAPVVGKEVKVEVEERGRSRERDWGRHREVREKETEIGGVGVGQRWVASRLDAEKEKEKEKAEAKAAAAAASAVAEGRRRFDAVDAEKSGVFLVDAEMPGGGGASAMEREKRDAATVVESATRERVRESNIEAAEDATAKEAREREARERMGIAVVELKKKGEVVTAHKAAVSGEAADVDAVAEDDVEKNEDDALSVPAPEPESSPESEPLPEPEAHIQSAVVSEASLDGDVTQGRVPGPKTDDSALESELAQRTVSDDRLVVKPKRNSSKQNQVGETSPTGRPKSMRPLTLPIPHDITGDAMAEEGDDSADSGSSDAESGIEDEEAQLLARLAEIKRARAEKKAKKTKRRPSASKIRDRDAEVIGLTSSKGSLPQPPQSPLSPVLTLSAGTTLYDSLDVGDARVVERSASPGDDGNARADVPRRTSSPKSDRRSSRLSRSSKQSSSREVESETLTASGGSGSSVSPPGEEPTMARRKSLPRSRKPDRAAPLPVPRDYTSLAGNGLVIDGEGDGEDDGPSGSGHTPEQREEFILEAKDLASENPGSSSAQVYSYLDRMQLLSWNSREAGQYLVDHGALDIVCEAMLDNPEDAGIQERGIHAIVRLVRAADSFQRETLITTYSPREYLDPEQQKLQLPEPPEEGSLNPVQTVVEAMRLHPEIMTLQLAGCNVLASFMSVGTIVRQLVIDYGGHEVIVDALRVRGRADSFDRLYFVHELAARALCVFCRCPPEQAAIFKEAIGDAEGVEQIVASLKRWTSMKDVPRDARLMVTRHSCAALRYLTKDCEGNAQRALHSKALLVLVRVLEANGEHAVVCLSAVAAMGATAAVDGETAGKDLRESNALACVVNVIRRHSDSPTLIRKGLQCIRLFSTFGTLPRRNIIDDGAVDTCLVPMQKYRDDCALQEHGCDALAALCRDEPIAKDLAASRNAVALLTAVISDHIDHDGVVEYGCHAIASLCWDHPQNQRAALKMDTALLLVRALKQYGDNRPSIVVASSAAIRSLATSKDPALAQRLLSLLAPENLVAKMKHHGNDPKVQENGCFAISAMCDKVDTLPKRIARRAGAVEMLVSLLVTYAGNPIVACAATCAVRAMVAKSREVRLHFLIAKLPDALQTLLASHCKSLPSTHNLILMVCGCINTCGFQVVEHKNMIGLSGIVEEVRDLVSLASEKRDAVLLRAALSTLCTLLMNSPDNQDLFQEAGGVEAILVIVQRWSQNGPIVELCCKVMLHSCGEHDGNRDEVKSNNGIRTLQGVLHGHPENPDIVTAACMALATICNGDSELQTSAGLLETIPTAVSAMATFANNHAVQSAACSFLLSVTQNNPRNKERVVRCGGRKAVIRAIELHPGNEEVNENGALALLQVQNFEAISQAVVSGSPPAIGGAAGLEPSPERGAAVSSPGGGDRAENEELGPSPRKTPIFSRRRRSRDLRPEVVIPSSPSFPGAHPNPSFGRRRRNSRAFLRRGGQQPDGAVDEDDSPEIHELDGGSLPTSSPGSNQPRSPRMGKSSRLGIGIGRRCSKPSVSSVGSSRGNNEQAAEYRPDPELEGSAQVDMTEENDAVPAQGDGDVVEAPRRRHSRGFRLFRRPSVKETSRGLRHQAQSPEPPGEDNANSDGPNIRQQQRDVYRRRVAANQGFANHEDDNDVARIADLDGLSQIGDEPGVKPLQKEK